MKYYLTYLNEEGESTKIELSNLPFFKDKSAGKILNIIAFYNQFDTPEDMLEYLYGKGLVDKSATADFRIVIKRKNKYDKEYYGLFRILHKYHDRARKASHKSTDHRYQRKYRDYYAHRKCIRNPEYGHGDKEHQPKNTCFKALSRYEFGKSSVCQHTSLYKSVSFVLLEHCI